MHYRVPVYNYFCRRFKEVGWEFMVRSNELQKENTHPVSFDFKEIDFSFWKYKKEIASLDPHAVILFLHLKDFMIWPLVHWLTFKKIPTLNWTKGANLDAPDSRLRYHLFNYLHSKCDGIILYSRYEIKHIKEKNRHKIFIANNTINFDAFPEITETKEEIKKELGIPFEKVVLSVGRMDVGHRRKKVHHLIEIFRDIKRKGVGLVIVGSGVNDALLERMNKENTLYLGEIHDENHIRISKLFKMADVFSVPGHVGLGLVQAFYWGLPVVTEEGFQPPEIHYLISGRNGFVVPCDDLNELKNKILSLIEDDDKRREFSLMAKKDITENASVEKMFRGFKNCIESLPSFKEVLPAE